MLQINVRQHTAADLHREDDKVSIQKESSGKQLKLQFITLKTNVMKDDPDKHYDETIAMLAGKGKQGNELVHLPTM